MGLAYKSSKIVSLMDESTPTLVEIKIREDAAVYSCKKKEQATLRKRSVIRFQRNYFKQIILSKHVLKLTADI